ncbi:MAG TPA: MFS transporter [Chitinophagaceae bacterium]|nr:MFS transporter [Chitinophagaceae bacterium]
MQMVLGPLPYSNRAYRIAVSSLFFLQGLCFATWASRIPTLQQTLQLSEGTLGLVLFALPAGSLIGLPLAGWLVTRLGSKRVVINTLVVYAGLLALIGLAQNITQLVAVLVLFGMTGNTANIAMNTQAVGVEARYGRNIMASFHGLWSLAGFTAAGIGSFMIARAIIPFHHFVLIGIFMLLALAAIFNYLLPGEQQTESSGRVFVMPDRSIITLGVLAFCCMICEGAMFDWSGIYFKNVVKADRAWIGAGYTAFMGTMAAGRFVGDWIANKLGFKRTLQVSGLLIATGLGISLIFPALVPAIAGFLLVGFGVSSVVPLVYSQAGRSKTLSPGVALAAVSSIGFLGFLAGPPIIGVVAGIWGLRISFLIIAVMGLCVAFLANAAKKESA